MKVKMTLLALLIMFFISCEEKIQDSTLNKYDQESLILKNEYDKNTHRIRFKWKDMEPAYSRPIIDWDGTIDIDGDWNNDGTQDWGDGSNLPSFPFDWGTEPPVSSNETPINPNDPWQTVEIGKTGAALAFKGYVNGVTYQYDYMKLGLDDTLSTKMHLEGYFFDDVNQVGGVPANKIIIQPANYPKTSWNLEEDGVHKYIGYEYPSVYNHQVMDAGDGDYYHWNGTQRYSIKLTYRPDTTNARVFEYIYKGIGALGADTPVTVTGIKVYENGVLVREEGDNDVLGPILE